MKIIIALFLLLLTMSLRLNAQDSPYKFFKRDGANVWFEAVYPIDSISKDSLSSKLIQYIPTISGVSDVNQNSEGLTASLNRFSFDYKAAGYTVWNCPAALVHPMSGNIAISVKDYKYRVVITNIIMMDDEHIKSGAPIFYKAQLDNVISKLNNNEFGSSKDKVRMFSKLEDKWYEMFKLNKNKTSDW